MADQSQIVPEPLSGGLVTARDPSLLGPGELTTANNAIYLPNDPGIHKVKGRTKYNSVAITGAGNVKGLRYLEFDAAQPLIAAHTDNDIYFSQISDETGSFGTPTTVSDVGSGTSMDAVHYENRYHLLIGAGQNTVVNPDGTNRKQGMQPVFMSTVPVLASGAWNTLLDTGFYHFVVTEVVKDGFGEIESTVAADDNGVFSKTTATALTTPTTQKITVTRPAVANTNATHWRVYMAGPTKAPEPPPTLVEFRLVGEKVAINSGTETMDIGNGAFSGLKYPGTQTAPGGQWSNPSFAASENNSGASTNQNLAVLNLTNFGFSGLTGVVTGIELFYKIRFPDFTLFNDYPKLLFDVTHNGSNFFPGNNSMYFSPGPGQVLGTMVQAWSQTLSLGNQYEEWGRTGSPPWALGDINGNASFGVRVTYGRGFDNPAGGMPTVHLDYVALVVHTTTGSSSRVVDLSGKPLRTVVVDVAGITTAFGGDGPPPVATTGDVFEGQLVLNDIGDRSMIKYSLPDSVESFPFPYFLNFETKTADVVQCIRRLASKLIVGLKHAIFRVNYLPRETDAEFDRGRSYEAISESEGVVGPMAAALFSPEGGPTFLAYVSHRGLRYTDGFQSRPLTLDIDWASTVRLPTAGSNTDYLEGSVLVDYPKAQQLWFYYVAPSQTTMTKALVIHYSSMHQKEGGTFKVTGPIDVPVFSATGARLGGNDLLLTGQSGGFVFVEDRGYTHNAGGTIAFAVETREMAIAGLGREFTVSDVFVRHRADTTSTVTVTPKTRRGANALSTQTAKTFTTTNGGAIKLPFNLMAEAFALQISEPGADGGAAVRITELALEVTGHGLPEPRTT